MIYRSSLVLCLLVFWPIAIAVEAQNLTSKTSATVQSGSAMFDLPEDPQLASRIELAANWLQQQIYEGTLQPVDAKKPPSKISVIAWHDPTLAPGKTNSLVGYLITDTLWAGQALKLTHPDSAKKLLDSLRTLDAETNGLQEVIFAPVETMQHQPIDPDPVHGVSIGTIRLPDLRTIDVRQFHLQANKEFAESHPRLFAEVSAYQSIHEFWKGDTQAARARLGKIFRPSTDATSTQPVVWDAERELLIDLGNYQQWKTETDCPQFPIKLGTVLYALRLTSADKDFPQQTAAIEKRLWQAQHAESNEAAKDSVGSVAHFFIVRQDGSIHRAPGATGEATAIAILASTVQRAKPYQVRE